MRNSSGLLTTCGGLQGVVAVGLAACGCQAYSNQTWGAAGGEESSRAMLAGVVARWKQTWGAAGGEEAGT